MTHRIDPSEIDPTDIEQVAEMVRSWSGQGLAWKDVPPMVQACRTVFEWAFHWQDEATKLESELDSLSASMGVAVQQVEQKYKRALRAACEQMAVEHCDPIDTMYVEMIRREHQKRMDEHTNGRCNGHVEPSRNQSPAKAAQ